MPVIDKLVYLVTERLAKDHELHWERRHAQVRWGLV